MPFFFTQRKIKYFSDFIKSHKFDSVPAKTKELNLFIGNQLTESQVTRHFIPGNALIILKLLWPKRRFNIGPANLSYTIFAFRIKNFGPYYWWAVIVLNEKPRNMRYENTFGFSG